MAEMTGSEILAKALKNEGTEQLFFLMGGPMIEAEGFCVKEGIRPIDVRHEQAAAMMGNAWSRLTRRPSVCMAASGPGVINLCTGVANAFIDCAPMVICGGASSVSTYGRGSFQDIDQVAIMKPMTKHAERVYKLSQRRHLVGGVGRDDRARRRCGHSVLHDAAGPRRAARRS